MSEEPLYTGSIGRQSLKRLACFPGEDPLLLQLTEVLLLPRDVPLSTFVSVGSALTRGWCSEMNFPLMAWRGPEPREVIPEQTPKP